ncbi:DUF3667 domain-containing protein [Jejudonia soesokkakensis]|uniref:DUF3667 domain-containing protein n=1 Tax=Jejudonia soesokkakensis TaxID=1323432 RepID=A0ABW2MVX0_9FLAO
MSKKKLAVKNKTVSENSRRHFKYRSNECLNCGQPLDLSDVYCPYCSQLNSTKSLSLKDFITEFFSSLVSYDSRLRYTISDLLFRPGTITKNYINGQRLRYTNPFRFFLSVSIIYFLLFSIINFFDPAYNAPFLDFGSGMEEGFNNSNNNKDILVVDSLKQLNQIKKDTVSKQQQFSSRKDSISKSKDQNSGGYWIVNGDTIYNKNDSYPARIAKLDSVGSVQSLAMKFQIFRDFYKETEIKNAYNAMDSLKLEKTRTNTWLYERNKSFDRIGDSPREFINYLFSKVPFFLFFFAPLFALFFWLLYARRKFTYMEHLVFIFHVFSFTFLALIITSIPDWIFKTEIFSSILFLLIGPIYFYIAMRKFYEQSYIKTFIKFILLNVVFFFSSFTAAVVFFLISAALY